MPKLINNASTRRNTVFRQFNLFKQFQLPEIPSLNQPATGDDTIQYNRFRYCGRQIAT